MKNSGLFSFIFSRAAQQTIFYLVHNNRCMRFVVFRDEQEQCLRKTLNPITGSSWLCTWEIITGLVMSITRAVYNIWCRCHNVITVPRTQNESQHHITIYEVWIATSHHHALNMNDSFTSPYVHSTWMTASHHHTCTQYKWQLHITIPALNINDSFTSPYLQSI